MTGAAAGCRSRPIDCARAVSLSLGVPAMAMPERSPLMSAAKTGTPASERAWASTWSVTVLAGAGGAGDDAVAVGAVIEQDFVSGGLAYEGAGGIGHVRNLPGTVVFYSAAARETRGLMR